MKTKITKFLVLTTLVIGCKKNDDSNATTSVLGKWSIQAVSTQGFVNGTPNPVTNHSFDAADYVEFKSNGMMQSHFMGSIENTQYRVSNDTIIFNGVNKAKIVTLSANSLVYIHTDTLSPTYYSKTTWSLRK